MPAPPDPKVKPLRWATICFIVSVLATIAVWWAAAEARRYGYALFVGVPLTIGLLTALLYQRGRVWKWPEVLVLSLANLLLSALWVLMCKIEGMVCILMTAILVAALTLIGILISWAIQRRRRKVHYHALVLLGLPVLMQWETSHIPRLPVLEQMSTIEVAAPPEVVWRFIPSFPRIEQPPSGWLATGLACPISSEIDGSGVGATRRCVLSTGLMPEVITVWEPARWLEFDVLKTPPSMVETNPFGEVHAAHTDGYFQSKRGRFILTPLPGGRTRIEGTSWFTQDLQPAWYWEPITRYTVSQVHRRVLEHIKSLAEQAQNASR